MKQLICTLFVLFLSGCQIDPYTFSPTWTGTDWFDAGIQDAIPAMSLKITRHLPTTTMTRRSIVPNILRGTPKDKGKPVSRTLFTRED